MKLKAIIKGIYIGLKGVLLKSPFLSIFIVFLFSIFGFAWYYQYRYELERDSFSIASSYLKYDISKENKKDNVKQYYTLKTVHKKYLIDSSELFKQIEALISVRVPTTLTVYGFSTVHIRYPINPEDEPLILPFQNLLAAKKKFLSPVFTKDKKVFKLFFENNVTRRSFRKYLEYSCYFSDGDKVSFKKVFLLDIYLLDKLVLSKTLSISKFYSLLIRGAADSMVKQYYLLSKENNKNNKKIKNLMLKIKSEDDHLNFWDFFYFSVITQSSTGYGDILPNKRSIRIAVSIQILISIILLTFILGYLVSKPKP